MNSAVGLGFDVCAATPEGAWLPQKHRLLDPSHGGADGAEALMACFVDFYTFLFGMSRKFSELIRKKWEGGVKKFSLLKGGV